MKLNKFFHIRTKGKGKGLLRLNKRIKFRTNPRDLPDTIPQLGFIPDLFKGRKLKTLTMTGQKSLTKAQKIAASIEYKQMINQAIADPLIRKSQSRIVIPWTRNKR